MTETFPVSGGRTAVAEIADPRRRPPRRAAVQRRAHPPRSVPSGVTGARSGAVTSPALSHAAAASLRPSGRPRITAACADQLIRAQATAARIACAQMTAPALAALRDSVERASRLPTRPGWEHKAAAHAEFFRLLAQIAGDRPGGAAGLIRALMYAAGPAANGMVINSRRRLLAHLRDRDADAVEQEMESHLRVLHFKWRLANPVTHGPDVLTVPAMGE
jgi:FCD domain